MTLTKWSDAVIADLVPRLAGVGGVVAVVLGGSYARGAERPDSDLDLGLLYRDATPIDLAALQTVIEEVNDTLDLVPSPLGGWGPWVNGGAWLRIDGHAVDLLYRSIDRYEATIENAQRGFAEHDYLQQPPFGFQSTIYLGEIAAGAALHDPSDVVSRLKASVHPYPPALRAALVAGYHWGAQFTLDNAGKPASRGDVYATLGCLSRASGFLVQVLLAHHERYPINDKGALDTLALLDETTASLTTRLQACLLIDSAAALPEAVRAMRSVCDDVGRIVGRL
jgi:predicted nucleotidyltransferase